MGSIDVPDFVKKRMKEKVQQKGAAQQPITPRQDIMEVPEFVKKKGVSGTGSTAGSEPISPSTSDVGPSPTIKNDSKPEGFDYGQNPFDYGVQSSDKNKFVKPPVSEKQYDPSPIEYEEKQSLAANDEKYPGTLKYDLAIQDAKRQRGSTYTMSEDEAKLYPNLQGRSLLGQKTVDKEQYIKANTDLKNQVIQQNNLRKQDADKSLEKVRGKLKEDVDYITNNLSEFTEKVEGGLYTVPNVNKINDYAKKKATQYGLSDEGYYKNLIYNEAKASVAHKIIEPKVTKKFDELYKLTYGETVEQETENEFKQGFVKGEQIVKRAEMQTGSVYNEISQSAKQEAEALNQQLTNSANQIKLGYEQAAKSATTQQEADVLYKDAADKLGVLNEDFLKQQNAINSKYNARYRRQVEEIRKNAEAKISEEAKKYNFQRSPGLQKKIQETYKEAYEDVVKNEEGFKNIVDEFVYTPSTNFFRTLTTSLGGAIKGISSTFDFDTGKVFGDYLQNRFQHGSAEIKSFRDFLDLNKLSKSSGQLVGGMIPSVIAAAGTAIATEGAGAPIAIKLLASGLAGWGAETADMTGRMYEDKFAETGSAAAAEKAAKQTLDSQVLLMPAYAFEGLPFLGKSIKLGKTIPKKMLLGGTVELATEFAQEYPQNLFEEAIRKDRPYLEGLQISSLDRAKNTLLNIAPVFLLGGGGQVMGEVSQARQDDIIRRQAQTFALKHDFKNVSSDKASQYLFDIMQRKGDVFATAFVGQLYSGGLIDQTQAELLTKTLQKSKELITNSEKYGLTPAQQKVYASMAFKKEEALQKAQQQTDPILKKIEAEKVKTIEDNMVKFVTEGTGDYVVMTYPNNEQYVLTTEEAEKAINNKAVTDAYANGDIKIETYGRRGVVQEKLDEIDAEKAKPKIHVPQIENDEVASQALNKVASTIGEGDNAITISDDVALNRAVETFGAEKVKQAIEESLPKELKENENQLAAIENPTSGDKEFYAQQAEEIKVKHEKALQSLSTPKGNTSNGGGGGQKTKPSVIMPSQNKSGETETKGGVTVVKPVVETEDTGVPPKPPEPPKTSQGAYSEQPPFTLIKSNLQRARARVGLEDFEGESVSNLEAATKAQRTIEDWKEKGIYEREVQKIMDDALEKEKISDEGQNILAQHIADLIVTKNNIKDKNSSEYDNVLQKLNKAIDAGDIMRSAAGRVLGRKLSMRGQNIDDINDVTDVELNMMRDSKTDILTEQQKEEAEKMWEDLKKAREEFEKYRTEKEAELAQKEAAVNYEKERKGAPKKDKTTSEKFAEKRVKLREQLAAARKEHQDWLKSQGIQKMGIGGGFTAKEAKIISQIITSYAHEGVVKFSDAVQNFISEFGDLYTNIDESDLNRIYSGEFNEKKETKNEITERIRDWHTEANLLAKYEKAELGEDPKTEQKKRKKNQILNAIREKLKNHPIIQKSEERKRLDKRKEDLTQRKKDLDAGIVPEKRERKKAEVTEEIKELEDEIKNHPTLKKAENEEKIKKAKQRLADLDAGIVPEKIKKDKKEVSDELAAVDKQIKEHELTRLTAAKESLQKRISKGEEKLRKKDYSIEQKKEPVPLDEEGLKLQDKLMHVENELKLRRLVDQHQSMSDKDKRLKQLADIMNLPRTGMTILDFSAVLRQGIMTAAAHPVLAFGKDGAFWKMFKATFSQKEYDRWFFELRKNDPRYDMMLKTKLALSDNLSHQLTEREEAQMSTLAERIPILGQAVKGSERAYTMFLNKMRVDIFNQFADSMEDRGITYRNNPKAYSEMASYINSATGRGNLHPKLENIAPLLSGLLFSPRLIASRLNMLTFLPQLIWRKNMPKEAIKSYFRSLTGMLATGTLVLMLASLDDDNEVELDPRSSDFGKIKNKNTRWDIWGGFQPYMRAMAQMVTGERKSTSTGRIRDLSKDGPYKETWLDILGTTARSKLAPVPAAVLDITTGGDIVGNKIVWQSKGGRKEVTALKYFLEHVLPLTLTGTWEAVQDQGAKGVLTVGVPSMFGVGTQVYNNNSSKPRERKNAIGAQ